MHDPCCPVSGIVGALPHSLLSLDGCCCMWLDRACLSLLLPVCCGYLLTSAALLLAPLCCRLALTQPRWEPCIHSQWPKRFRDAARLLLLAAYCPQNGSRDASDAGSATADCSTTSGSSSGSGRGGSATAGGPVLPLDSDALLEVLQRAAFPISAWLP